MKKNVLFENDFYKLNIDTRFCPSMKHTKKHVAVSSQELRVQQNQN